MGPVVLEAGEGTEDDETFWLLVVEAHGDRGIRVRGEPTPAVRALEARGDIVLRAIEDATRLSITEAGRLAVRRLWEQHHALVAAREHGGIDGLSERVGQWGSGGAQATPISADLKP